MHSIILAYALWPFVFRNNYSFLSLYCRLQINIIRTLMLSHTICSFPFWIRNYVRERRTNCKIVWFVNSFEELINPTITSCMSKSTCKFVYLLCNFLDNIFKQLWYTRTDLYKCVLFISNIIHRFCLHLYVACPSVSRVGTWKMVWIVNFCMIINSGIIQFRNYPIFMPCHSPN